MSSKWWQKKSNPGRKRACKEATGMPRRDRRTARLWLERLEDRLAPATFSISGSSLLLDTSAVGATMGLFKSGPNQVQVVLGTAGDLWQGTDDSASGITGNGLTTLTIDTSLFTGDFEIDGGSGGDPTPLTLTFHGTGANGPFPSISSDWGQAGTVGNIVVTGGAVALSGSTGLSASGALMVSSPITASGNLVLDAPELLLDASVTVDPSPAFVGLNENGNLSLDGSNITINAPVETAPIATTADLLAVLSDGLDDISINAAATLTLNAPVSTGQIGSMDQPVNVGPVSGEIDIVAGAVVGNAQGELSTGSAYGTVGGGGLGFASGAINITTSGDITLPAPVAISTGDAFANPDPITGGGGSADGGAIGLFAGGNICADGITAPLHLHFGQGEGSDVTGQLHAEPVGLNPNDELTLGSPNGANEFGSGNIYLACTGSLSVDMEGLYPHANAHQTIDIATTGDLLLRQFGFNSGPAQLSGDDISLASSGGILSLDVYEPNNAPIVDLGTGNLTLAADEINLTNGFYDMSSDFLATDAIQGTGSVLLQPATPGRNIAIGGDNTLDSALNLSDNDVAAFAPGFKSITIGRAADGTGTVDVLDNVTFGSPTTIYGGSISGQGLPTVTTTGAGILSEWANRVIGFSSQYQDPNYPYFSNPASSALGPPDTAAYGNFQTAWAPAAENGTQEYLEIGYLQPVYATGVTIQETDGNGFVYQVDLLDTDGNRHTVFTGPDNSQPGAPAGLDIAIPQTSYLVAGVQVYVNTDHDLNNREEIDAVQLQGVTPANDLTLHARTGSIGGAASTTNVYTNVFPPNTNPYAVPDLACYLPAGAHYSAQVRFSANVQDLDLGYYPVFTVLVDGTPLLTQVASTVDQNTGDGSVDLELDVPASDASLPALHSITVQLAPVYAMLISEQTVTTTMPGGGVNHPIGATAGGTLNLISDAGNGAGNIFVTSGHALTLQQNVFTTTGPGHNSIGLETTAGDITVPSSEPSVLINDLFLIAAGSVNLPIGLSLTAPALTLSADGALNLDLTQRYAATIGDMTLKSGTTCIGTSVQPIKLRVGGKLNLATVSTTGGDADIYVTAPAALVVGTISTGPGATVEITTTAGGITLAAANETSANVSLNSAGPVELFYPGSFQAQSFSISAAGSIEASNLSTGLNLPALLSQTNPSSVISGDGVLTAPDISLNAGGDISAALTGLPLFSDGDIAWSLGGVTLNASAAGDITIFSPGNDLKIASLTSTPGHNVTVGAGAIATSFSSGLTGDNVVLGTQPAPRIRRDLSFSSHLYVDYANSDLVMDLAPGSPLDFGDGSLTLSSQQIEFDGAAGSITGTGPLLLNAGEITRNGTGGGAGLNLTNSTLDVFAPGFSSITINCDSVTIAGDVTFACPITINGSSIDDPGANTITTSASTDLTLHATTAAIGGAAAPVFVNVGGKLNLSADAGGGQGDIFVTSKQALTLGQNVTLATGPDRDAVVLSTSAGGITVPASVTGNDDLTLQSAADLTIADGVTLSEASLNLNAGGALVTGPTTKLVTTSSDMDLTSSTAAIGTSSNPVIVRVAGKLNLTTKAPGGANGDINITSPGSVAINTITTGPDADTIHIGTTGSGGVVLAGNSTLNDNVTITSAGTVAIETGIDFQGQSIGINSTGSITNTGSSTTVNGGTVANGIIQALASVGSTPDPFGVSLASTNGSLGASGSPLSIEAGSGSQFTASSGGDQDISAANGGTVAINTDTADGQTIHIDGGSFDTTNNASISSGSTLEVGSAGTLDIGTNDITVNSVTQDGGQILSSGGHLNTGGVTATAGTINIHVFGIHISIPIIHINPSSGNTVTLAGQNTNSTPIAIGAGQVAVADDFNTTGPITINPGNGNTSQVTLANNSTPAAAGNVATVGTVGLSLPPDPAILETTGLSLGSGTTLNMGAMGPAAQTGYGQIIVDGAVSLNNPTLAYAFDGYTPSTGTVFDIIQNKGGSPISGTFSGLPEGTVFKAGAEYLRISYLGGASGHDVTLTVVDRPPTVTVITPSLAGGTLPAGTTSLQIGFGEDVIGAGQAANYQLQSAGPDGLLGTADDVNVPLTVSSADGTAGTTATLTFAVLADGLYRLTVKSAITDTSGTALAGGGDGTQARTTSRIS